MGAYDSFERKIQEGWATACRHTQTQTQKSARTSKRRIRIRSFSVDLHIVPGRNKGWRHHKPGWDRHAWAKSEPRESPLLRLWRTRAGSLLQLLWSNFANNLTCEGRAAEPFFAGGKMRNLERLKWWEDYAAKDSRPTAPGTSQQPFEWLFAPFDPVFACFCMPLKIYTVGGRR